MRRYPVVGQLLFCLFVTACGGSDSGSGVAGQALGNSPISIPAAANAAATEKLSYRMQGVSGALRTENAVVMVPAGDPPAGGWPVVAWGHGALGLADQCAPSASTDLSGYAPYLNGLLAAGYAIVAADYEGLGTPGLHPFLNLESEARSILQAVNAATRAFPTLSSRFAIVGHSQGGHAALGAAQFAGQIVPALTHVATVGIAPASNVRAQASQVLAGVINNDQQNIALRIQAGVGRVAYTAMILAGIQAANPSFDYAGALGVNAVALGLEALAKDNCLGVLVDNVTAPVQTALGVSGDVEDLIPASVVDVPAVDAYLTAMEPGTVAINAPVLLIQGDLDTTVLLSSSQALEDTMKAQGTTVSLSRFDADDHVSIVGASLNAVIMYLNTQFAATPQDNS